MPEPVVEQPAETEEQPAQAAEVDWKAEARKWEQRAKDNHAKLKEAEPILQQWQALEEASKTNEQRFQEQAANWQSRNERLTSKLVSTSIKALASTDFADPSDAISALDPSKYVGLEDEIDEVAIKADLDALLERKPHWRRPTEVAAPTTRVPAPNHAQGAGGGNAATDPRSQFAAILQGQLRAP